MSMSYSNTATPTLIFELSFQDGWLDDYEKNGNKKKIKRSVKFC